MHLGTDGPSANLKFQEDLKKHFEEITGGNSWIWSLTCGHLIKYIPHKVHTFFKKEGSVLPIDTDQFVVDLHGFFKLSAACREDHAKVRELTKVASKYVLCHSSVRWLTLKIVLKM